jgi:transposase-like protein
MLDDDGGQEMHFRLILSCVDLKPTGPLPICPYQDCGGTEFDFLQAVDKPIKDIVYESVIAHRYKCMRCQRTFRVYPQGVTRAQISKRVQGLAALLYLLGLSYGAVSLTLEALEVYLCKSQVYTTVQTITRQSSSVRRERVFEGIQTNVLESERVSVMYDGRGLTLEMGKGDVSAPTLIVDGVPREDIEALKARIEPIATAVGIKLLVIEDVKPPFYQTSNDRRAQNP